MTYPSQIVSGLVMLAIACLVCLQVGCVRGIPAERVASAEAYDYDYVIGPGDTINVFVWGVPELSQEEATVRPDGRISLPLVEDLMASGKTPTQLARELEQALAQYVREPLVTLLVGNFQGVFDTQIRVIGEVGGEGGAAVAVAGGTGGLGGGGFGAGGGVAAAAGAGGGLVTPQPRAIPYITNMTLLDVMIQVGGLTPFAAGNRAKLIRSVDGEQHQYRVRLKDLIEDGDMKANVKMAPGDILIVPTAWF
jgi:polysaccharide export outer membrane protein